MGIFNQAYTAPAVNDNLVADYSVRTARWNRTIKKIGFVGGAAIADGEIEIYVGSQLQGVVRNNDAGDVVTADLMRPCGDIFIPAGIELSVILTAATGADNYTLYLDVKG